jgi:hypothetical protein
MKELNLPALLKNHPAFCIHLKIPLLKQFLSRVGVAQKKLEEGELTILDASLKKNVACAELRTGSRAMFCNGLQGLRHGNSRVREHPAWGASCFFCDALAS